MEKFSVKKPFTVLVGVIMILALGIVSVTRVSTDLLPEFSLPYLMVIAPYPGASPERIETTVTEPLENALGTITGVKNISSTSNENYALVQMEFENGTNMDSTMVKVSGALDQLSGSLPDAVGTPTVMEISMDMLATMYVAVSRDGQDIYELSDYVRSDVIPYLERQEGVASVTTVGLVEKSVQVELNAEKIADLNDRILEKTDSALTDAREKLDEAQEAVDEAQAALEEQEGSFGDTVSDAIFSQVDSAAIDAANTLRAQANDLIDRLNELNLAVAEAAPGQAAELTEAIEGVEEAEEQLRQAQEQADAIDARIQQAQEEAEQAGQSEDLADQQAAAAQAVADAQAALAAAQAVLAGVQAGQGDPAALEAARQQLEEAALAFAATADAVDGSTPASLAQGAAQLAASAAAVHAALLAVQEADPAGSLSDYITNTAFAIAQMNAGLDSLPAALSGLQSGYAGLTQAQLEAAVGFSSASTQLAQAQAQLEAAREQYDKGRETALKNANADALLTAATLSQLIYAQNFAMPAGYIDDRDSNAWLLRIGDEYETSDDIANVLLIDSEELGAVRLSDVADITVIDNADDSYASLNGSDGVILCLYKGSTSGTNEVSRNCRRAFADLEERFEGTHIVPMMDQGVYITWIIRDILSSILLGAALAILVLALFLRAVKPTVVVAISIPLSVLFALVLMYFSDLSLNMMTLSGLSLGIGMLVDNSIVVMENIFRLRGRGIPAARAAVQGAKQVRGAIVASTLTTICVFAPSVFASGTVRQLLTPLALTIGYCLAASLIIALTVVPAASSALMQHTETKELSFFTRIQETYGRTLRWCLRHRALTLLVAVVLLVVSVWQIIRMGIVFLPEMTSSFIEIDISTPEEMTREESYAEVDKVLDAVLSVDGVIDVGIMDESSMTGLVSSFASSGDEYGFYVGYLTADEQAPAEEIRRICSDVEAAASGLNCKVKASSGDMSDLTNFSSQGGGLTLNVYGQDLDKIRAVTADIKQIVESVDGYEDVRDGTEEGEPTLQLHIDRDKATSYGLTVAQIYQAVSQRVETSVTSTTITVDDLDLEVTITDPTDPLTKENLLDMEFATTDMSAAMAGGMAGGDTGAFDASAGTSFDMDALEDSGDLFSQFTGEEGEETEADTEKEEEAEEEKMPETILLRDIATVEETTSLTAISRENMSHFLTVTAKIKDGYNTTLLTRELEPLLQEYAETMPHGYTYSFGGETSQISDMLSQMMRMLLLALLFIYLIMVAQFQSLLSPFIVLFTIPLAFTGGIFALLIGGQQLTLLSLMGFLILMGTVVNNGIVFVDYANQLRIGGLERRDALVATGKTRMRPILMTALTTILAMVKLMFGTGMGSQLGSGMATVITGGLIYATFMTLYIIPVIYDLFFRRPPLSVDVGEDLDDIPDDAAEYLDQLRKETADGTRLS